MLDQVNPCDQTTSYEDLPQSFPNNACFDIYPRRIHGTLLIILENPVDDWIARPMPDHIIPDGVPVKSQPTHTPATFWEFPSNVS